MKVILVGIKEGSNSILELEELCKACDMEVSQVYLQDIDIQKATYIGSGKLIEIEQSIKEEEAVIFDGELTPLQIRNISEVLSIDVLDRTDLILHIFDSRAHTKEAQLQVEIARLKYELPRLSGAHSEIYSQQGGKGFRGAGEQQIEIERRHIRKKLSQAKKELAQLKKERKVQRSHRTLKKVAIVGYTNSGKSTLLNLFTDKKVLSQDMLFATLETATRRVYMREHTFIMSDTVGFISHLPHHLIEAFKSTLEEVKEADLILHVVDGSSDEANNNIKVTQEVLCELGVKETPVLYVYNKCDLPCSDLLIKQEPAVTISSKERIHIDELEKKIIQMLYKDRERLEFYIPYQDSMIYSTLLKDSQLIKEEYDEEGIKLIMEAPSYYQNKYKQYIRKEDKNER